MATYTVCGVPSSLSLVDNNDNTLTLSCKVGANGTTNAAEGVEVFVTCDGTQPTASNFTYKYILLGAANITVSKTISFANLNKVAMVKYLDATCIGAIKFTARTIGAAGSNYCSSLTTVKSTTFVWHEKMIAPKIIAPRPKGDIIGCLTSYKVIWSAGADGINNALTKYTLRVYDMTAAVTVATYSTTNLYYLVPASLFTAGHTYRFFVKTVGTISGLDSEEAQSGLLQTMNIDKFSTVTPTISDGNTVPAIDFFDYPVFADIGTGTVAKISWTAPVAMYNMIDYYDLTIKVYDSDLGNYLILRTGSVGNVNEYYITSSLLSAVTLANYKLYIDLTAVSKYGMAYNSSQSTTVVYVSSACGTYMKVTEGYSQPIMKRTIAFAKLGYRMLYGEDGKALTADDGKLLYGKSSSVQANDSGWTPMQDFYTKDPNGNWQASDIAYEVLTDSNGEIITDSNNSAIYIL